MAVPDGSPGDILDPPRLSSPLFPSIAACAMYDSLIVVDGSLQPQPGLASSWDISSDFKTWTFHIRRGVQFHDGSALTSKDVAYSIKLQIDPNGLSPNAATLGKILKPENVTTLDDYTVRCVLDRPNVFIYVYLWNRFFRIVKDGATSPSTTHIGTGPFVFKSFVPGKSFTATRNPNYWQDGKPYLDEIQLIQVPDAASEYQALLSNQVDVISSLALPLAKSLQNSPDHGVVVLPDAEWHFMVMDSRKNPLFQNRDLVRAIKQATNRSQIIDTVFAGFASTGYDEPIPSSDAFFNHQLPAPQFDVDGARSLLKSAGYPDGVDIGELVAAPIGGSSVALAQVIQQQLAAANIRCTIRESPASTFFDDVWLKAPLYISYNQRRTPADIWTLFYGPRAPWQETGVDSPELENAVNSAFGTADVIEQKRYFGVAEQITSEIDTRVLPVFASQVMGVNKKLLGLQPSFSTILDFTDAYFG